MANASTVRRQIAGTQQLTIASLLGTTIGTTPTAFQLNNNGLTLTGGGVLPLSAGVTGLYQGTGQVLHIRSTGTVSTLPILPAYTITNVALTSNVATILSANAFVAGQTVTLSGLTTATFLNGQTVTVLATGLSGSQFEFNFTHANYATAADTGSAALTASLSLSLYEIPASLLPIANTLVGAQTFTNWNLVGTAAAQTITNAQASWSFDARVQLDAEGDLTGQFTCNINHGALAIWSITNNITGLVGEADLNFVIVATQSALTTLTETEFSLDLE